jgi:hypothetical protein
MILVVGLIILVAAVVVGVAGVLANGGHAHALSSGFAVFGYHVTGSTGTLFLYGIVVGVIAMLGLSLLLSAARRSSRRGREARQGLRQSRRETAAATHDRDQLLDQREAAQTQSAGRGDYPVQANSARSGHRSWRNRFTRGPSPEPANVGPADD